MRYLLPLIWLPLRTAQLALEIGIPQRVTQTSSWNIFELPGSGLNSQYWALSLSVINSDAKVALMVRRNSPPELGYDNFTADFLDLSSWQYNLSSHALFFQPSSLGNSSVYAGVYFFGHSPATYQIQLTASRTAFCPSDCLGRGICDGYMCKCQSGYIGIDCRLSTLQITSNSLTTVALADQWRLISLPGNNGGIVYSARVTLTVQAAGQSLSLQLYMSAAKAGYALHSGDLFPGDCYSETQRRMEVSGAVALSLDLKCDCEVYFSLYNAGESVEVSLQSSASETGDSGSSGMSSNLPLIVGICGFSAVAVLGMVVGCAIFVWKRRNFRRVQVQEAPQMHGIAQEKVDTLYPHRRFSQLSAFHLSDTCSVCLERFKPSSDTRVLPCKHVYHTACIDLWFQNNHVRSD